MQMPPPSRIATAAALTGWSFAAALLAVVLLTGPLEAPGLVFDRLTAALVLLVVGISAMVAIFATRYLQDDPRLGRFLGLLALTTAGTVVFTAAASLTVLVAGWLVAGAGFCLLLEQRRDAPGARAAVRRTARAFAVGDIALVLAAAVALVAVGDLDLRRTGAEAAALQDAGVAGPVAVLLVIAALVRCAQAPLHRWLPATIAAPTPVCALLHAGLVNAGGILLVRLGPVVSVSDVALALLLAAGLTTMLLGGAALLARTDVKGALAHSTMAQMGFMLVQVALGAVAAAVVHLIGHAMYKAALFLGSGSAIGSRRRLARAPRLAPHGRAVRTAAALGLPLAALAAAVAAAGGTDAVGGSGTAVLLVFAWASGAHAIDGWLRSGPPAALRSAAVATVLAAGAYVALLAGAKAYLAPALPTMGGLEAWVAAPLVLAVAVATAVRVVAPAALLPTGAVYAWLVDLGAVRLAPARRARRLPAPARPVAARRPAAVAS